MEHSSIEERAMRDGLRWFASCLMLAVAWVPAAAQLVAPPPANPAIDAAGFLRVAEAATGHRDSHRISEDDFLRMRNEPGTIVLDARSAAMFELLHVRGALNLSFPDIAVDSLRRLVPDRRTRILIYCNNNFRDAATAFPTKLPMASLNLSTYVALYSYGYRNVYELAPQMTLAESRLPFEGTLAR
jgi:hypothetical protein